MVTVGPFSSSRVPAVSVIVVPEPSPMVVPAVRPIVVLLVSDKPPGPAWSDMLSPASMVNAVFADSEMVDPEDIEMEPAPVD